MINEKLPIADEKNISQTPALELLKAMGYKYRSTLSGIETRGSRFGIIYKDIFFRKLMELNSYEYRGERRKFSEKNIRQAIADIDVPVSEGLVHASETIYNFLFTGKSYLEELPDGSKKSYTIKYIKWDKPWENEFTCTDEFQVENEKQASYTREHTRPDIVCFVNGIPFAVLECKKASISVDEDDRI